MRTGFAYVIVAIGVAVFLGFVTAFARQVADGLPLWILGVIVVGGFAIGGYLMITEKRSDS